jgi:hypothetical protein
VTAARAEDGRRQKNLRREKRGGLWDLSEEFLDKPEEEEKEKESPLLTPLLMLITASVRKTHNT